jgi:hypothetical protein
MGLRWGVTGLYTSEGARCGEMQGDLYPNFGTPWESRFSSDNVIALAHPVQYCTISEGDILRRIPKKRTRGTFLKTGPSHAGRLPSTDT